MTSVPPASAGNSGTSGTDVSRRSRPEPLWPVTVAIAVLAVAVAGAAQHSTTAMVGVVVLVQAAMLVCWVTVADPPSPRGVAAIAASTAVAADFAAFGTRRSLTALAAVVAFAVLATIVVQLARGVARARVTEAMAASLGIALGAVSVATLLVLLRPAGGTESVTAAVLAMAVALLTARFVDRMLPLPQLARGVRRGGLGILLGAVTGTAATAGYASTVPWLTPQTGAMLGVAVSLVAVLADLAVSYALITAPAGRTYSFAAGPLVALAAIAPVAYLFGLLGVS